MIYFFFLIINGSHVKELQLKIVSKYFKLLRRGGVKRTRQQINRPAPSKAGNAKRSFLLHISRLSKKSCPSTLHAFSREH